MEGSREGPQEDAEGRESRPPRPLRIFSKHQLTITALGHASRAQGKVADFLTLAAGIRMNRNYLGSSFCDACIQSSFAIASFLLTLLPC